MRLLSYEFDPHRVGAEQDEQGLIATYVYEHPKDQRLNRNASGPFVRLLFGDPLPKEQGVYALTVDDQVVYLGRARGPLRERWGPRGYAVIHSRNTHIDGQSTNCRINASIGRALIDGAAVTLWTHVTERPVKVEVELERALRPPWNVQRL